MWQQKNKPWFGIIFVIVSALLYTNLAYFFQRENFLEFIVCYTILFAGFLYMLKFSGYTQKQLLYIGIFFRIIFFVAIPSLSQDFYRFIWDGYCCLNGVNPYVTSPAEIMTPVTVTFPNQAELVAKMGSLSENNFSNYPPLKQLIFAITAFVSGGSILINIVLLRLFVIVADIGLFLVSCKLLRIFNLNSKLAFLYFLNPLVILELTGNLHFEGIMAFLFVGSLYFIAKNKIVTSSFAFALSVLAKIMPLQFIFILFRTLQWKKWLVFSVIAFVICLVSFLPFLGNSSIPDFIETTALWFTNFEFNGSVYNLIKYVGTKWVGYNPIAMVGRFIIVFNLIVVAILSLRKSNKNLSGAIESMVILLSVYFFMSTTVHPWYVITILALSVFTSYSYILVWTFTAAFSYYFYSQPQFQQSALILFLEYLPVLGLFFWEMTGRKSNRFEKLFSI